MDSLNFKPQFVQIDLFGSSVEVLSQDGCEYVFYLLEDQNSNSCYLKKKSKRKKKWSSPELIKGSIDKQKTFKFSEENEFGFVLN